ncbi:telomerase reverse transcriptase [Nosema bombycis CQ1]|uniref:Telomerase reverse transcriptase n=1 Tax=Nosema bombycis (strain CQ1 / CVCC 102059) TaxID=578461 RepID=R0KQX7_NOSB1|nr:telomerase reverse transcriptase [Nosema bombycis CQ1]|eukprot:EOB12617.1 telomerase reverse transcriptase [Nosema bombycis CQ1]
MREVYFYKRNLWYEYSDYHTINFLNEKCVKDVKNEYKNNNLNNNNNLHINNKLHNVRCIPKKDGARIIVNLSKSLDKSGGSNKLLYPMYSILKREVRHKLGNSALGYEDMHQIAYPFFNELKNFYILKLDLRSVTIIFLTSIKEIN